MDGSTRMIGAEQDMGKMRVFITMIHHFFAEFKHFFPLYKLIFLPFCSQWTS